MAACGERRQSVEGRAPIEKTEPTPERDGIYAVTLTFPKPGKSRALIKIPRYVRELAATVYEILDLGG